MALVEVPFADLLAYVVDNRGRTCPTSDEGRPLIATNCIRNDRLYPSYDSERFVSEETYRTWFRGHPLPGDLIFVCKGSPGRVAFAPNPVDFCIAQDMVAVRADSGRIYPKYLLAALRSPQVQQRIESMHVGTLIPHFKKGDFDKLLIPLPDRRAQIVIGDTYYELSEKIELNHRTAQALERLARAIFRAWFVDFEPVKAKAEGATLFPSMPQSVFDALPARFVGSEIGTVPHGWDVLRLDEILVLQRGFDLPKQSRSSGPYRVLAASGQNGWHSEWKVKGPGVTTGRSGVLGQVFFVRDEFWPLNTSLWVKEYLRSNPWHAYFLLQVLNLAQFNAGSAVPTLNRNHVHSLPVVAAPDYLLAAFAECCGAIFSMGEQLATESDKLAETRDYLLRRLLSGDIRAGVQHE